MIYYFSGTGNSRYVAALLAQRLNEGIADIRRWACGGNYEAMKLAMERDLTCDETLGLFFPVYAWGPPTLIRDFIKALPQRVVDACRYTYSVCTCGDDIGCTDRILAKYLGQRGLTLSAMCSIQMPNTYVALLGFTTDAPQVRLQKISAVGKQLDTIAEIVQQRAEKKIVTPGQMPWTKSYILRPLFNKFLITDKLFSVEPQSCNGCGRCKKVCPLQNIAIAPQKHSPVWLKHCAFCLACYHHCPQHAIVPGPFGRNKGQHNLPAPPLN